MDNEHYGKIAYDAYCEHREWKSVRGESLPQWAEQSKELREAWVKAADAVLEEHQS